jgi:hypothetical protein
VLPGLRIRNMIYLTLYVLGLLTAILVLYIFAQRAGLHHTFFTYRASVKLFGQANTISPFAIIPTLLAIVITLWWESIDTTCRTVQPLTSVHRSAKCPSKGLGLSYASSFWLFASLRALRNSHWLLSVITATTFTLQIRKSQSNDQKRQADD